MKSDAKLGREVAERLRSLGIETPMKPECSHSQEYIASQVGSIMGALGLDLTDDSLRDTPRRVAKMFCEEIFSGLNYDNFPKCTTIENKMGYDEVVLVRNCVVRSMCEHHMMPIYGRASIGYIPGKKVLGLSKFTRVVDFFASRFQVQERLTEQVYAALSYILATDDIAVVVEASHFCMRMRGVEESCSDTVTSKLGGRFRSNDALRAEVMGFVRDGHANIKL